MRCVSFSEVQDVRGDEAILSGGGVLKIARAVFEVRETYTEDDAFHCYMGSEYYEAERRFFRAFDGVVVDLDEGMTFEDAILLVVDAITNGIYRLIREEMGSDADIYVSWHAEAVYRRGDALMTYPQIEIFWPCGDGEISLIVVLDVTLCGDVVG